MTDKTIKGRQSKGETHGRALLTHEIVKLVRERFVPRHNTNGISAMSREFGVSRTTMNYAVHGVNWREAA
jgi:hypothetical protein